MIIFVLAGGLGTRLAPVSTKEFPKPFISFSTDSMLKQTVKRFVLRDSVSKIMICVHKDHKTLVEEEISAIDTHNKCRILLEPERKNTLAAITFCLSHLDTEDSSESVFVVPIDHFIYPEKTFISAVETLAKQMPIGKFVCFGIKPTSAETEYGYIRLKEKENDLYWSIKSFIEKPSKERAKILSSDSTCFWNMGVLGFYPSFFYNQLLKHLPVYAKLLKETKDPEWFYSQVKPLSVDKGLLQKSQDIVCALLDITWSDIGSLERFNRAREILQKQGG